MTLKPELGPEQGPDPGPEIELTIDADRFDDIAGFYDEINRVFMAGEDWQLGPSLDALNDMLYGGYGALAGRATTRLIWKNIAKSRNDLGVDETRRWLTRKLERPEHFNGEAIRRQLADLENAKGSSFFSIVMEIIADHPTIQLVEA